MAVIGPTGQQHEIRHGDHRAVLVEVGGGLRSYEAAGRELLDGFGAGEICTAARGQQLIPWPNRVRDGSYRFGDEGRQLALTEPAQHHAIHGLARWANWTVADRDAASIILGHVMHAHPGYPWVLTLRTRYSLDGSGLHVAMSARNSGTEPCPVAMGMHPYLRPVTPTLDGCTLRIPAATRMVGDERQIPTGWEPVAGGEYDFRDPRPLGGTRIDLGFTDLLRDDDGLARIELRGPDGSGSAVLLDGGFPHLMIFTGDALAPAARRRGLGVEPMTCAPDAFNNGRDLRVLVPGEELTAGYLIEAL